MTMINNQSSEPETPKMGNVEAFLRRHDLFLMTGFSVRFCIIYWIAVIAFCFPFGMYYGPKLAVKLGWVHPANQVQTVEKAQTGR